MTKKLRAINATIRIVLKEWPIIANQRRKDALAEEYRRLRIARESLLTEGLELWNKPLSQCAGEGPFPRQLPVCITPTHWSVA